ncbi:MAG: zinc ribbon domain-containing protein [Ktedonobacterales bacterium]
MGDSRSNARGGERCWQCKAPVRPGAAECRNCGAQLVGDLDESAYLPARRPEPRGRGVGGGRSDARAGRPNRYDAPDPYDNDDEDEEYDARPRDRPGSRPARSDRDDLRRPRAGGDGRGGRSERSDRGRRYAEPVYDESVESAALDPSAEYPAYSDDSREDYAYRDPRNHADRGGRGSPSGRDEFADEPTLRPGRRDARAGGASRDDANGPDPLDDPRAPNALRSSRSRPLDERDAYPADPRRSPRGSQGSQGAPSSRGRSRSGGGYDDYATGGPGMGEMGGMGGMGGRGPQSRGLPPGGDPRDPRMGGRPMGGPGGYGGPLPPQGMKPGMGGMGMAPGGLMPGIPGTPGIGGPAAKPAEARRGAVGIVIGVIAVLLLIAIVASILFIPQIRRHIPGLSGGAGSSSSPGTSAPFATYTAGPTPTVLPNDKQFSSTQSQYILNYPTGWKAANQSNVNGGQYDNYDTFSQTNGVATIGVEQAGEFASSSDQQIIQSEVDSVKAALKTVTVTQIGGLVSQNVGGETWQRAEYTVVNGNATWHMSLLACHHNGKGYAIVLLDTASNFHADDQTIFEPTLKSFRFS